MERQRHTVARGLLAIVFVASLMAGWVTALADEATPPGVPTVVPMELPTDIPTDVPTDVPTQIPTEAPTEIPATVPPHLPTEAPTEAPEGAPTEVPGSPAADGTETPDDSPGTFALFAGDGVLVVTATDAATAFPVTGVCFSLFTNLDSFRGDFVGNGCDFDDGQDDGQSTIAGLAGGSYILAATWVEPGSGYLVGGDRAVMVASPGTTNVTFNLARGGRDVSVLTVDADGGATIAGACFDVYEDPGDGTFGNWVSGTCDGPSDTEGDGVTVIAGLPTGATYILYQWQAPAGYVYADDLYFTLTDGSGPHTITVENTPIDAPGNLVIDKRDEFGDPLSGACFSLFVDAGGGVRGDWLLDRCDGEDGNADGLIVITGLEQGAAYVLTEYHAPEGYTLGYWASVTISGTQATVLNVTNSPGGSSIGVRTEDAETGDLLGGACYMVHLEDGDSGVPAPDGFLVWSCDASDGSEDGVTSFTGLLGGTYVLEQLDWPGGYVVAPYVPFAVDGTTDVTVTVENAPLSQDYINIIIQLIIEILLRLLADM